jgi:nicotinamide-nucleotide amidase
MMQIVAQQLHLELQKRGIMLTSAESCTGGWLAKIMTDTAGSSASFDRGFVTYSNAAKMEMLNVSQHCLEHNGAVSEAVVAEMTIGALQHSQASIAVAISGIAGPSGGTDKKPIGTVCFAWQYTQKQAKTSTQYFKGDRDAVRQQAVLYALERLLDYFKQSA